jgi:hypothetical protein
MLAFVLLWSYMSFSQFLIQYSGNLAEEVPWYNRRMQNGWQFPAISLFIFHFAVPFMVLLVGSDIKRNPTRLARVGLFIILMRFVDITWWIAPTFREHAGVRPMDVGVPLLLGGIWLAAWSVQLKNKPLLPRHDTRLLEHLPGYGHGHGHGHDAAHHPDLTGGGSSAHAPAHAAAPAHAVAGGGEVTHGG